MEKLLGRAHAPGAEGLPAKISSDSVADEKKMLKETHARARLPKMLSLVRVPHANR